MEKRYTANGIKWLKDMEHVRVRPAMYIGSLGSSGLHQLVTILLDDVMDDALEGHCRRLTLTLSADGSISGEDDGRGIPIELHKESGRPILELIFTKLGACNWGRKGHAGHRRSMYGLGVSVITALSDPLVVETTRDGGRYRMRFARGTTAGDLERLGPTEERGTLIRFGPDRTIFEANAELDQTRLVEELHGLTALVPGLTLGLVDARTSRPFSASFCCPRGLADLAHALAEAPQIASPIAIESGEDWPQPVGRFEEPYARVRVAIQMDASQTERLVGFANHHRTDVGTHIEGLACGLDLGFKDAARALGLTEPSARPAGLRAVVAIDMPYVQFEGAKRERLANPQARDLVARVARKAVAEWAHEHAAEARHALATHPARIMRLGSRDAP